MGIKEHKWEHCVTKCSDLKEWIKFLEQLIAKSQVKPQPKEPLPEVSSGESSSTESSPDEKDSEEEDIQSDKEPKQSASKKTNKKRRARDKTSWSYEKRTPKKKPR